MKTETQNDKITQSVRFEPMLHAAISKLATDEKRPSISNTIEWLLTTHPRVKKILETEAAEAAA